ncbi:MAG: DUF4376 domain-containing protein [Rubrivivax sp.]
MYLLADTKVLIGGQPAPGMGYSYGGNWSLDGAAFASQFALIWWNHPPQDEAELAQRGLLLIELRSRGALYEGAYQPSHLLGTSGPQAPSDYDKIGMIRDYRKLTRGYKVGQHWFHSDHGSRGQQLGLVLAALQNAIPGYLSWKTMSGESVPMTSQLALQIFQAAMVSDATYHAIGEAARAQLQAGTLTDIRTIQWPPGYGDEA